MMNYLLDTHTLIWFITEDPMLPETVKKEIKNINNTCCVSIASLWEIAIKLSLNKLELNNSLQNIIEIIDLSSIDILPINTMHVIRVSTLPLHHRDPFDRLIIAQSISENYTLLSKDNIFKSYAVDVKWG